MAQKGKARRRLNSGGFATALGGVHDASLTEAYLLGAIYGLTHSPSLRPADDNRPQFRAWCHRQAFWEPKGNGKKGQSHVFHVTNRPEGKGQGAA
jgi:hypothetical protein